MILIYPLMIRSILTRTIRYNCSSFKNHYQILDVPEGATFKEIKEKYILKSKAYHPDVSADSHNIYHQVQSAYKMLINPDSRKKYDLSLGIHNSPWEKEIIGLKFKEEFQTQQTYDSILRAQPQPRMRPQSIQQNLQSSFSQQISNFSYFSLLKSVGFIAATVSFALCWTVWSGAELFWLHYRGDVVHKVERIHTETALKIVPQVTR